MDAAGTHAPVAEEKILDSSSRLRSSARLSFASTSSTAAACRIARRKRKKRRRQRRNSSNDDVLLSTTVAGGGGDGGGGGGGGGGGSGSASGSGSVPASGPPAASGSETSGNPEEEASLVSAGARAATSTGRVVESGPAAIQLENGKQKSGRVAQINNQSGGGSGSARAAASSVGSGITLLNRRAGKRSSRRCNASSRRNAMTMDLQKLITEVHARPAIWDQKNVNYHNRDVILKMWREIARACEVSTDVAKSKWKHLRDNFRNELKKSYRGKCEGNGNEHDSKWVWFKSLFFLRDQMNSRVIGCALSQNCSAALRSSPEGTQIEPQIDILEGHEETQFEDLDADSCHSLLSNDDALHHVMPPPKLNKVGRKRTLVDTIDNDYPELDRKRFESLQKRLTVVPEEEDDTYHFLMSVRNPLRSLPLDRQMFIRLKIQELVYNEINSQNQQQQSRGYDGSQDVKPLRPGHASNSCGSAGAGNDSGEGEVVNDMSNSASLLPNCATEGSSGDAFFT